MSTQNVFEETTKVDDTTEYLWGPEAITETTARGAVVVGMASIQKQDVVDFKTKVPTGEKLIWLVFQPNAGRAQKMRFKFAAQAIKAYNAFAQAAAENDGDDETPGAVAASSATPPVQVEGNDE